MNKEPNEENFNRLTIETMTSNKDLKSFFGAKLYIANSLPKLLEKTDRVRQLLRKKTEWTWSGRKKDEFNEIKKLITKTPCLAHFARNQDKTVTTNANRTGLGITLWTRQNDSTIRPSAFASHLISKSLSHPENCFYYQLYGDWRNFVFVCPVN